MRLRSFKLRFHDQHVRVVPATDAQGCPFSGPGVDILGDEARMVLEQAGPLISLLRTLEPEVNVRSLALDLEKRKLLATVDPAPGDPRYRVIRIDQELWIERLLDASAALLATIEQVAATVLERRPKGVSL